MMNFHETKMGHIFFEHQLPQLIRSIDALAAALEKFTQPVILDANALADYIQRGGLETKSPGSEEAGICPICGGKLGYVDTIRSDNGGLAVWTCPDCGATGKEGYDEVFDQHYDVVEGPSGSEAAHG